jgi:acetyl-CoA acetyltransferase
VVLVTGGENGRSAGQAERLGVELPASEVSGEPDRKLAEDKAIFHDAELARGMNSASDIFAIIESAVRFARREPLSSHARRVAKLWADFSAVACQNPNAWIRRPYTAEEIGIPSAENPMISYPYTRLMNANARVDMAAGLLLCSLEIAREAGVPDEKIVYLHARPRPTTALSLDAASPPAARHAHRHISVGREGASRRSHRLYSRFLRRETAQRFRIPAPRAHRSGGLPGGGPPTAMAFTRSREWPRSCARRGSSASS